MLNLKATELSLGLPGSQSPKRELDERPLFPLLPSMDVIKSVISGNKRGFSDAINGFSDGKLMFHSPGPDEGMQSLGKFPTNPGSNMLISSGPPGSQEPASNEDPPKPLPGRPNGINPGRASNNAPAANEIWIGNLSLPRTMMELMGNQMLVPSLSRSAWMVPHICGRSMWN
ncbi:hypothetical protein SAY87_029043 [Trapa incisa]|uniref:Uncharacterized protein n=1 Tax=Trapa incisa TaxID=236973 RepID=A0AAN7KXF5_9MYRT|nr:hypothetical protein SAY87_029043 [Trapa incisa]